MAGKEGLASGELAGGVVEQGCVRGFFSEMFFYLWMALVGNLAFDRQKRILGGLKAYLRQPRTIPLAILLVENIVIGMVRGGRKIRFRPPKIRFQIYEAMPPLSETDRNEGSPGRTTASRSPAPIQP
jgi:hypothetical protein